MALSELNSYFSFSALWLPIPIKFPWKFLVIINICLMFSLLARLLLHGRGLGVGSFDPHETGWFQELFRWGDGTRFWICQASFPTQQSTSQACWLTLLPMIQVFTLLCLFPCGFLWPREKAHPTLVQLQSDPSILGKAGHPGNSLLRTSRN